MRVDLNWHVSDELFDAIAASQKAKVREFPGTEHVRPFRHMAIDAGQIRVEVFAPDILVKAPEEVAA